MRWSTVLVMVVFMAVACGDDGGEPGAADADSSSSIPTTATEPPAASTPSTTSTSTSTTTTTSTPDSTTAMPYEGYVSEVYDDPAVWICRPGADDVCAEDQDLTLVHADGSLEVVPFERAADTPVDCFYVYPTISSDFTPNSDLVPDPDEEIFTARSQAARYGSVCNVYAPLYRQNTIPSMLGQVEAPEGVSTREVAYADVLDAFKHYMATANGGRGFVLLGHSQGAGLISRLIAEEIDGVPALQERFVTAHVLGSSVPADGFATIAPCTSVGELGCVVSYATFRETAPPPPTSFFGRTNNGPALCTNPADLGGGPATMHPEYLFNAGGGGLSGQNPFTDPSAAAAITTPWVGYPDFIVGTCVDDGTFGYLSVEILGDPADPRADDIGGDLTPDWGLHLADAQVGMGDLVALVEAQVAAFVAAGVYTG